jgi:hypothetical protein
MIVSVFDASFVALFVLFVAYVLIGLLQFDKAHMFFYPEKMRI